MGFKDILKRMGEKNKARKQLLKDAQQQLRVQEIIEERSKSANERELNRFLKEEREENIKEQLDFHRKQRDKDIRFGHNPLDVQNITSETQWEVLKEKNMFAGRGNMFQGQSSIHKNNSSLLNNGNILSHGSMFVGGGGLI